MKLKSASVLISAFTVFTLSGCANQPESPETQLTELDNAIESHQKRTQVAPLEDVPAAVQQELLVQNLSSARSSLLAEKRLEIAANGVPAAEFFAAIVEDSEYSIAVHPDVTGDVVLNLKDITVLELLDVVRDLYGYDIRRSGRVIKVYPAGMRTETIALNYLFVTRNGNSMINVNSGGVSGNDTNNGSGGGNRGNNNASNTGVGNQQGGAGQAGSFANNTSGTNIFTQNKSDYWEELKETLTSLVGTEEGRSIIVSPQSGLITVRAFPGEIEAVRHFIERSEEHLRRQVIIEAKILEVTLSDAYQQGVNWEQLFRIGSTEFSFGVGSLTGNTVGAISSNTLLENPITTAIGGNSSLQIKGTDFTGVIDLLQTQGNVQVLSSPRITATNNQKAVIKVGEDEYFVTEVSATTTTGTSTTTTPEIGLTPFFTGIALDVTPQIDVNGEVILHVHPSVTLTEEQEKTISIDGVASVLPLAQSRIRESDTVVRAESGEIIVIGGLIEEQKEFVNSKTPLLGDIPGLGELFKSKSELTAKKELVIMLKPVVVGKNTWQNELKDARALLQQWFPDSE